MWFWGTSESRKCKCGKRKYKRFHIYEEIWIFGGVKITHEK